MTSAVLDPDTSAVDGEDDDGVRHYYCCDPDVSMCGQDISECVDDGVGLFGDGDVCALCTYVLDGKLPCTVASCRFRK